MVTTMYICIHPYYIRKVWISVNDAANGIPLGHPNPHGKTHTRDFNTRVYKRLKTLEDTMKSKGSNDSEIKDALLNKLREIENRF